MSFLHKSVFGTLRSTEKRVCVCKIVHFHMYVIKHCVHVYVLYLCNNNKETIMLLSMHVHTNVQCKSFS